MRLNTAAFVYNTCDTAAHVQMDELLMLSGCEVISTLHAGDSFGELSLLYNIRREANQWQRGKKFVS